MHLICYYPYYSCLCTSWSHHPYNYCSYIGSCRVIANKETDIDGYLICIMTDCTLKSTTSQSVACTGIPCNYHIIMYIAVALAFN